MFTKAPSDSPQGPSGASSTDAGIDALRRAGQKHGSLIDSEMSFEGNVTGGGDLQIDGSIKGDVRIARVTVSASGKVEGGIYADTVEVRGRVTGSITAKQVRLYDQCHMDGDITHEVLSVESGAFFQGRSTRNQSAPASQAAAQTTAPTPAPKPPQPPMAAAEPRKDNPFPATATATTTGNGVTSKAPSTL